MAGAMAVDFPVLQQFDVSAARDEDMLDLLRKQRGIYEAEKRARGVHLLPVNLHLAALNPSKLPSCFLMSGPMGQLLRPSEFIERSYTAIRARGTARYIGTKCAMEFRPLDGAKSDWVMIEYTLLGRMEDGCVFLQNELVLRLVFRKKNKAKVLARDDAYRSDGYAFATPDEIYVDDMPDVALSPLLREKFNEYMSSFSECLNNGVGPQPKTKRPRSTGADGQSDVWREFTKIYVEDEHGKFKLAYGVCHICDKLLKAPSSNGTKTLWRHNETCSCKQVKQQTQ